jgi:Holliday junction resolvase
VLTKTELKQAYREAGRAAVRSLVCDDSAEREIMACVAGDVTEVLFFNSKYHIKSEQDLNDALQLARQATPSISSAKRLVIKLTRDTTQLMEQPANRLLVQRMAQLLLNGTLLTASQVEGLRESA